MKTRLESLINQSPVYSLEVTLSVFLRWVDDAEREMAAVAMKVGT